MTKTPQPLFLFSTADDTDDTILCLLAENQEKGPFFVVVIAHNALFS